MDASRFDSLTDEQRECLRLVAYQRMTSKQIGRVLNRSKTAIDQRLDRARVIIGAPDRDAAARAFLEYKASGDGATRDRVTRDPQQVADRTGMAAHSRSAATSTWPQGTVAWVEFIEGLDPDNLTIRIRALLILLCAVAFAMMVGGLGIGSGAIYALLVQIRTLVS